MHHETLPRSAGTRLRQWWHHTWTLGAALLGLAMLGGSVLTAGFLPETLARERAFRAARPCPADAAPQADCLHTLHARVRGTVVDTRPKQQQYTLRLQGPPPVPAEIDFQSPTPLLQHLRPGDEVTLTQWRSYTVTASRAGTAQHSTDTPVDEPELVTGLSLILLTLGSYTLHAAVLCRRPRPIGTGLPPVLAYRGKAAMAAAAWVLPAGFLGATWGGPPVVLLTWAAVLPGLRWWLRRRGKRAPASRHRSS
ncbi:hypothetical protein [Kitasatospora sp. NPDC051914]|uniref:hypothetical protein n=1 Tax=Kitasatospora sp. NPDC051914 TaxID=3154945 RepID=UPI00342D1308